MFARRDRQAWLPSAGICELISRGARIVVIEDRDHIPVPGDGEQEQLVRAVFPFLDENLQAQNTKPKNLDSGLCSPLSLVIPP